MFSRLSNNFGYKVLALICACALHFYVQTIVNPKVPRTVLVPLSVQDVPPGMIFDPASVPSIAITVNGPSDTVDRLQVADFTAFADVAGAKSGINTGIKVHVRCPEAESGDVDISDIQPSEISLVLQPQVRRTLPITASQPGLPPAGYAYKTPFISPASADVVGDQTSVNSVSQLVIKADVPSSASTIDTDGQIVPLDANGQQVNTVTVVPPMAHLQIGIARVPAMKVLVVSPTIVNSPPFPYRIDSVQVKPESVVVSGRPERLNEIGTISTAPIDVGGAVKDIVQQAAPIAPSGTVLIDKTPVTVTVHIVTEQPELPAAPKPPARPQ